MSTYQDRSYNNKRPLTIAEIRRDDGLEQAVGMSAKEPWSSLNALKEEVNALLKKNDVTEQTKKQLSELEVLADDLNKKMNVLKEEAANALKEQLQQLIDLKKQTLATANLPVNTPISLSVT